MVEHLSVLLVAFETPLVRAPRVTDCVASKGTSGLKVKLAKPAKIYNACVILAEAWRGIPTRS